MTHQTDLVFDEKGQRVYYHQTEEGKRMGQARAGAYQAAVRRLKNNHAQEFAKLVEEERLARGLPAQSEGVQIDNLRARIHELEQELEQRQ